MLRTLSALALTTTLAATAPQAQTHGVFLQDNLGAQIQIATLDVAANGSYSVDMTTEAFTEHFLSMRPFKCLEGPNKHWCHLPYPYEIRRSVADDLIDLEYDFLFLWKGASEYGINTWNGVYYRLEAQGDDFVGHVHDMDMGLLAVPPDAGILRPVDEDELYEAEASSHWLPRMIVTPLP